MSSSALILAGAASRPEECSATRIEDKSGVSIVNTLIKRGGVKWNTSVMKALHTPIKMKNSVCVQHTVWHHSQHTKHNKTLHRSETQQTQRLWKTNHNATQIHTYNTYRHTHTRCFHVHTHRGTGYVPEGAVSSLARVEYTLRSAPVRRASPNWVCFIRLHPHKVITKLHTWKTQWIQQREIRPPEICTLWRRVHSYVIRRKLTTLRTLRKWQ